MKKFLEKKKITILGKIFREAEALHPHRILNIHDYSSAHAYKYKTNRPANVIGEERTKKQSFYVSWIV